MSALTLRRLTKYVHSIQLVIFHPARQRMRCNGKFQCDSFAAQTWRTFLSNHVSQLASVDFFTVYTVMEAREYAAIEERIAEAEQTLEAKLAALNDPAIASNAPHLLALSEEIEEAQKIVNQLYERWAELGDKQSAPQSEVRFN